MAATTLKDKVVLSTEDYPDLAEYFSRLEPGDKCKFQIEASLDDNTDGTVILSIEDVTMGKGKAKKPAPADDGEDETEPEPAAVQMYKDKAKTDDESSEA